MAVMLRSMHPRTSKEGLVMFMEELQFREFVDHFPVKEYRIKDGQVEARILDGGSEQESDWRTVSSDQLSSHVKSNTTVARWLERNLGWRRLLRACVHQ